MEKQGHIHRVNLTYTSPPAGMLKYAVVLEGKASKEGAGTNAYGTLAEDKEDAADGHATDRNSGGSPLIPDGGGML